MFPCRVKLVQWQGDAYDQDLLERTRDACQGDVDIVIGCINLGAPLQRSFKCLKKGGIAFLTEEMNDKVLKSLEKLAVQQNRKLKVVERCGDHDLDNLAKLLKLVKDGHVSKGHILFLNILDCFVHYRYSQLSCKTISKQQCS